MIAAADQGLTPVEIERRVRAWVAGLAVQFGDRIATSDGLSGMLTPQEVDHLGSEQSAEIDMLMKFVMATELEKAKKALVQAASGAPSSPIVEQLVEAAAIQMNFGVPEGTREAKIFRQSVLRNLQTLIGASVAMAHGEPMPDEFVAWTQLPTSVAPDHGTTTLINGDKPLSELWDKFCASKVDGNEWKRTETVSARTTLTIWIKINGDKPLQEYTTLDVERFRKVYRSLPQDYYHKKEWKRIYETDGPVRLSEVTKKEGTILTSAKSWNKHLSRLNECWKWGAGKAHALPRNYVSIHEGFFIKIPKDRTNKRLKQDRRARFNETQLKLILSSPLFFGAKSKSRWKKPGVFVFRDHRYWGVLIGLLHGMRREEPFVLKVRHVKSKNDIWYFDLLDPEVIPLLKDVGSPRMVPLHKDLIELGFLELRVWGRNPDDALFPEALSHSEMKRAGGPFGQWFLNFRRSLGIDDEKLDFHSARHTVISGLLEAGVPESHIEEICGHEGEERRSELSTYDHGRLLETLKDGIDKWVLPYELPSLIQAVIHSDYIDPKAANPRLDDPSIVPRPRRKRGA